MIIVNAIRCPICGDVIYSRVRHDCKSCSCGNVFIDGGFDYIRTGIKSSIKKLDNILTFQLEVYATKRELYDDWNLSKDKYGLVKGLFSEEIKKSVKSGKPEAVYKGKKKSLFARFLDAIFADAKKHPEKLHTSDEVWDKEWSKLLDRPAKEIPQLKKLFKGINKKKRDSKLIKSLKRGIMDLKKGKYISVKDLDKFFKEL